MRNVDCDAFRNFCKKKEDATCFNSFFLHFQGGLQIETSQRPAPVGSQSKCEKTTEKLKKKKKKVINLRKYCYQHACYVSM
jgi:hypothetical protein